MGFGWYRLISVHTDKGHVREEDATIMTSNHVFTGVDVAGMSRTLHASVEAHPAHPAAAAAAAIIAAPRKRRAAAGTTAASVNRGSV